MSAEFQCSCGEPLGGTGACSDGNGDLYEEYECPCGFEVYRYHAIDPDGRHGRFERVYLDEGEMALRAWQPGLNGGQPE